MPFVKRRIRACQPAEGEKTSQHIPFGKRSINNHYKLRRRTKQLKNNSSVKPRTKWLMNNTINWNQYRYIDTLFIFMFTAANRMYIYLGLKRDFCCLFDVVVGDCARQMRQCAVARVNWTACSYGAICAYQWNEPTHANNNVIVSSPASKHVFVDIDNL